MQRNKVQRKPAFFMTEGVQTPPMSVAARREAGFLVGRLQDGATIGMPMARLMPEIGSRCLELRVRDETVTWRVMCRVDADAVIVIHVFAKKTETTPRNVIRLCQQRLAAYDATA